MPRVSTGPRLYVTKHPRTPFLVRHQHHGVRRQFWFSDRTEAEKKRTELAQLLLTEGVNGMALDATARADYFAARQLLGPRVSMVDAARFYAKAHPHTVAHDLKPGEVLPLFLRERQVANQAARTTDTLETRLTAWFNGAAVSTLGHVTRNSILDWLARADISPRTRVNDLAAIRVFCTWLTQQRYLASNPAEDIPTPQTDASAKETLSNHDAAALMAEADDWMDGVFAPYFAIALFAGLRPTEIAGLKPDHVVLRGREPFIRVIGGKRRRTQRIVPISDNLKAWLTKHARHPFLPVRFQYGWRWVRERAGVRKRWSGDICRHTWASNRMAILRDEARLAREAGHRPDTTFGFYHQATTRAAARGFFGIVPKT